MVDGNKPYELSKWYRYIYNSLRIIKENVAKKVKWIQVNLMSSWLQQEIPRVIPTFAKIVSSLDEPSEKTILWRCRREQYKELAYIEEYLLPNNKGS